jgi:hypothetical protein
MVVTVRQYVDSRLSVPGYSGTKTDASRSGDREEVNVLDGLMSTYKKRGWLLLFFTMAHDGWSYI